jgi:hypothetical protein
MISFFTSIFENNSAVVKISSSDGPHNSTAKTVAFE